MKLTQQTPLELGEDKLKSRVLHLVERERYLHTWVMGEQAEGTTKLLRNAFMQDVVTGRGCCFFDTQGDQAQWLLERIPYDRVDDVLYFDATDPNYVLGFNPLHGIPAHRRDTYAKEIVAAIRDFFPVNTWGGQIEDILTTTFHALLYLPDDHRPTMASALEFLTNDLYRWFVLKWCKEKAVVRFWEEEYKKKWSTNKRKDALASSTNKLRVFQSSPTLRAIFSQKKSGLDFGIAMATNKIVIIKINRSALGAFYTDLTASLMFSRLQFDARNRPMPDLSVPGAEAVAPGFHVYVPRFNRIATETNIAEFDSVQNMRVSFMVTNQHLGQLRRRPGLFDALTSNTGNKIAFTLSAADAEAMQGVITTHEKKYLMWLKEGECYASLSYGEGKISGKTEIQQLQWDTYNASSVIRASNSKRARLRTEVEEAYQQWIEEPYPLPDDRKARHEKEAEETTPYSIKSPGKRTVKKKKDKATKVADKLEKYRAHDWQVPSAVT